jgi:hypothetical protein
MQWSAEVTQANSSCNSDAEAALRRALAKMAPGGVLLRDRMLSDGAEPSVRIQYTVLHPRVGVAFLDPFLDPAADQAGDTVRRFQRRLDELQFVAIFGEYPPILVLHQLSDVLDWVLSAQPALALPGGDAWVTVARRALLAAPTAETDDLPLRKTPASDRRRGPETSEELPSHRPLVRGTGAREYFWAVQLLALVVVIGAIALRLLEPSDQPLRANVGTDPAGKRIRVESQAAAPAVKVPAGGQERRSTSIAASVGHGIPRGMEPAIFETGPDLAVSEAGLEAEVPPPLSPRIDSAELAATMATIAGPLPAPATPILVEPSTQSRFAVPASTMSTSMEEQVPAALPEAREASIMPKAVSSRPDQISAANATALPPKVSHGRGVPAARIATLSAPQTTTKPAGRAPDQRCRNILIRSQLGEELSNVDLSYLSGGCRPDR